MTQSNEKTDAEYLMTWVDVFASQGMECARLRTIADKLRGQSVPHQDGQPSPAPATAINNSQIDSADSLLVMLVKDFGEALLMKLRKSAEKYGYTDEWKKSDWADELRRDIRQHVEKGDPLDVAAYTAFAWHHRWSLKPAPASQASITDADRQSQVEPAPAKAEEGREPHLQSRPGSTMGSDRLWAIIATDNDDAEWYWWPEKGWCVDRFHFPSRADAEYRLDGAKRAWAKCQPPAPVSPSAEGRPQVVEQPAAPASVEEREAETLWTQDDLREVALRMRDADDDEWNYVAQVLTDGIKLDDYTVWSFDDPFDATQIQLIDGSIVGPRKPAGWKRPAVATHTSTTQQKGG